MCFTRWFATFLFSVILVSTTSAAPRFTELMAVDQTVIADEDGEYPDWIEIHNPDAGELNLAGWKLTDDASKPAKWTFPAKIIPPGGYLVVFCSEKDRLAPTGQVHTSFRLSSGGERLQLRDPSGALVHEIVYPVQIADLSFDGADYLSPPTPGAANTGSIAAVVRAPEFSRVHGFCEQPFALTLTSATVGAQVHYTLDGTEPTPASPKYSKPLRIAKTTCVRSVAFLQGKRPSPIVTQTYIFLKDVVTQSPTGVAPRGWPKTWGTARVDYGMDPRVAQRGKDAKALPGALKSIPTISIVIPLQDLFDPAFGIYANPDKKGRDWERPMSLEVIYPDGTPGTQVNAGLRIRGGASRGPDNPKHNFRVLMRKEYGAEALEFPLFGPDGARRTERFDLRCEQLIGWVAFPDENADFIRDIYGRDTQLALGQPAKRGDFYHLYINGQYWGLYQTDERVGAEFAAEYFGGKEDDYDTVKINFDSDATGGGTDFVDGSFGAWRRAVAMGYDGFEDNDAYFRIQGLNADGTRNEAIEPLIDVDNLIDYMLAGIFIAADDSPPSFGTQNNWYGVRSRKGDFGFRFFAHDWEISMYDPLGLENRVGPHPTVNPFLSGGGFPIFAPEEEGENKLDPTSANPWHFWEAMRFNPEFRLRVADHVHKFFFNDGALTQEKAVARWRARMEEIDQAVIGESARWGDGRQGDFFPGLLADQLQVRRDAGKAPRLIELGPGQNEDDLVGDPIIGPSFGPRPPPPQTTGRKIKPYTRDTWLKACQEHILDGFLANRSANVLQHLREGLLYPSVDAPSVAPFGGPLAPGQSVTLSHPLFGSALPDAITPIPDGVTIYYTTNGSDPRLVGGAVSPSAKPYTAPFLLAKQTTLKARAQTTASREWSALVEVTFLPNVNFGALEISEIHYHPDDFSIGAEGEFLELRNGGPTPLDVSGFRLSGEISYTFPAGTVIAPGAFHVLVRNGAVFSTYYPGVIHDGVYSRRLGDDGGTITLETPDGVRVLAVDYDDEGEWTTAADGFGFSLVYDGRGDPDNGKNWRPSTERHGSPGAPDAAQRVSPSLIVSKVGRDATGIFFEIQNVSGIAQSEIQAAIIHGVRVHLPEFSLAAGESRRFYGSQLAPSITPQGGPLTLQRVIRVGDEEFLSADLHRFRFGPLQIGTVYGRVVVSDGREFFPRLDESGAAPALSSLRIEEIQYASGVHEFVEIANLGAEAVNLASGRLDGLGYQFPAGAVIPAESRALVVAGITPEAFRTLYNVPAEVPIYGPAVGTLQDNGEAVALRLPVEVEGITTYPVVEELRYNDRAPWPIAAAGRGHSLQRVSAPSYSAEPAHWSSAAPTPGLPNEVNAAPTVRISAGPGENEFTVVGSDPDGAVQKLELIVDGTVIARVDGTQAVFTYKPTAGVHDLWAQATDDQGATAISDFLTVDASGLPDGAGLGLRADFFTNVDLAGDPAVSRDVAQLGGSWFHLDPADGVSRALFSVRYTGKLVPRSNGQHQFFFRATGGFRFFLNGELAVEDWTDPRSAFPRDFQFDASLKAGDVYDFVVEYFDDDGLAALQMEWSEGGSFRRTEIPTALFYLPTQDPAAPAIAVPSYLSRRFLGQQVDAQFMVLNAPSGTVSWTVESGNLPAGLTLRPDGALKGIPTVGETAQFVVRAAVNDLVLTRPVTMQITDRREPAPIVRIIKPGSRTNGIAPVEAGGVVESARPIVRVRYSLNSGLWHDLPAGSAWGVTLTPAVGLVGGDNILSVVAEDEDGRISAIADRHFVRRFPAPLTVAVNGAGTVTPGFLGRTIRTVGERYRVTATPAPGYLFLGWEGFGPERTLQFTMSEGLALIANFAENPYLGASGNYVALLGSESRSHLDRGRANVRLTEQGLFTGVLEFAGGRYVLKGKMDSQGTGSVFLVDDAMNRSLGVSLLFDRETKRLSVDVTVYTNDGARMSNGVFARLPWNAEVACPQRGRWKLTLTPPAPIIGVGSSDLTINALGALRSSLTMPDGRTFLVRGFVDESGRALMYSTLAYDPETRIGESLSGDVTFDAQARAATGTLLWSSASETSGPKAAAEDLFAQDLVVDGTKQ